MDFSNCVNTVGFPKYCTVTFDDSSIMCIVVMRPWLSGFIGSMKLHMICSRGKGNTAFSSCICHRRVCGSVILGILGVKSPGALGYWQ